MRKVSGGLVLYRRNSNKDKIHCLVAHPGGPFFKNKDEGWWSIPKGEPELDEDIFSAARREFEEETGYLKSNIKLVQNIIPYEEIFTGSNMKSYKHKYFIGHIESSINQTNDFQETEVSEIKWCNYEECIQKIRPYNLEKIAILNNLNIVLRQYRLY